MDDITYCASDCECINCKRNKANIKDHSVLHSWCIPEDIADCPMNKGNNCKKCNNHYDDLTQKGR